MPIFLFLSNAVCYAGQSATGKFYASKNGQAQAFNLSKSLAAFFLFLIWLLISGKSIHLATAPIAMIYGICLTISMYTGFMALSCGPMALTSIMAAMSLLVPFFWGLLFWQEKLSVLRVVGVSLLLIAIVFINYKKQGLISKKWLIYSLITMIANGFCSVIQKHHQTAFPGQYQVDFMLFAMATVLILLGINSIRKRQIQLRLSLLGILSGVLNGLANFIILILAARQSATTLFPLISAGNVMSAWLSGILLFHERPRKLQFLGLIVGCVGLFIINY